MKYRQMLLVLGCNGDRTSGKKKCVAYWGCGSGVEKEVMARRREAESEIHRYIELEVEL